MENRKIFILQLLSMKTTKYETIFKKERIKTMVEYYSRVGLEILRHLYFIGETSRRDLDYIFKNHDIQITIIQITILNHCYDWYCLGKKGLFKIF